MDAAQTHVLGCGQYRVFVQTRGGQFYVCELLDLTDLSFSRVLNETSEASVTATTGCCGCLAEVNPWQHEIAIFRNDELVWVGPIIDLEFDAAAETIKIYAKDLLVWADNRVVELADRDYDPTSTDVADAYQWLLEHAYCKDPWGMTWGIDPVGIPIERYYPSFNKAGGERWGGGYTTIGDELRTLSEAGVDYTVINRHLWGGSIEVVNPVGGGVVLFDHHFRQAPLIKVTGSKQGTRFISAGGDGGYTGYYDDQIYIYPPQVGPMTPLLLDQYSQQFGLIEKFTTTKSYDDVDTTSLPNAIAQDAKTRWDLLVTPYTYVESGQLDNDAPVNFNTELIPGGIVTLLLSASCRPLSYNQMRIKQVEVSYSGNEESVSVTFQPLGTSSVDQGT